MGLEVGHIAYLKLDNFDPQWRQAVVLCVKGKRYVLAVRVTVAEVTEEVAQAFSHFECESCRFLLVEGKDGQLRDSCSRPLRGLEVATAQILAVGIETLDKENLQYATASEDVEPGKKSQIRPDLLGRVQESSSEEPDEEGTSGDEVFKLLKKAQRLKQGGASGSERSQGSETRKKTRYPFLKPSGKEENPATSNGLEKLLEKAALSSQPEMSSQHLNALVTLELLKTLRGEHQKKDRQELVKEDDGEASSSLDSSSSHGRRGGAGRAMRSYRKGHQQMKKHPLKHVRRYIRDVELQLGAGPDTAYSLSDYTKKLNWGNQRSLLRTHYALSEILQTLLKNRPEQAALELVQLLKAVHQTALDQGSWRTSWLLLRYADPLEVPRFGGEPQELERVAAYLTALQKLEKKQKGGGKGDQNAEGGKGRQKGKPSKKTETAEE